MDRDTTLKWIVGLSIIGLMVAAYQTYEHYYLTSAVCDLSQTFSCSVVTESRFGEMPLGSGIATALWGAIWWVGLIGFGSAMIKGVEQVRDRSFLLFSYIVAGFISVLYYLTIELYILPQETGELVICPFCTVQHILIVIILILGYTLLEKPLKDHLEDIFYMEE